MQKTIGIRREDKNKWERRVPLVPDDVLELRDKYGIKTIIQPSTIRVFSDDEYRKAGAEVKEDLQEADVIFAVKEIPTHLLAPGKTYLFFSHTIKGQPYNMAMLKNLMDLKCNLIDYELIAGKQNNRLITFSSYAGFAGLIETLYAFGQKMKQNGYTTPFESLKQAYQYNSLTEAKEHIREIGEYIATQGLPKELTPLTVGFLGYGNVSKGAQEMFNLLPFETIEPDQLKQFMESQETATENQHCLYKIVFKEADIVESIDGTFDLQEYFTKPERFQSVFSQYLPYLKVLINGVYWTEKYPRFVTKDILKQLHSNGTECVSVIGDISCDIDGSVEITHKSTKPDNACYTYHPQDDSFTDGISKNGVTVMAIDNLPCEFPREASIDFSKELATFVNGTVTADFKEDFSQIELPYEIKKSLILHNGELTEKCNYMSDFL